METFYKVYGNNDYAVAQANFGVVACVLQDDPKWCLRVFEQTGINARSTALYRRLAFAWPAVGIQPENATSFLALGTLVHYPVLAYRIQREEQETIRIIPIPYLSLRAKLQTILFLAVPAVFPAFLAPLIWQRKQRRILQQSRLYLDAFCRTLIW